MKPPGRQKIDAPPGAAVAMASCASPSAPRARRSISIININASSQRAATASRCPRPSAGRRTKHSRRVSWRSVAGKVIVEAGHNYRRALAAHTQRRPSAPPSGAREEKPAAARCRDELDSGFQAALPRCQAAMPYLYIRQRMPRRMGLDMTCRPAPSCHQRQPAGMRPADEAAHQADAGHRNRPRFGRRAAKTCSPRDGGAARAAHQRECQQ